MIAVACVLALAAVAQVPDRGDITRQQGPTATQAASYTPEEAAGVFRVANDAFARDEVNVAIEGYERLLAAGYGSEDVEYNAGTAYLKMGKLGPAILHFERALRIAPLDADARANIEQAQRLRVDKLVGAPEGAGTEESFVSRVVSRTNPQPFTLAFLAAYFLAFATLLLRRFATAPGARTGLALLTLILILVALPSGAVVGAHAYARDAVHTGVVMPAVAQVKEGPSPEARTSFEVHEGLKVQVLGEDGSFVRVRLANGLEGWTDASAVTLI